MQTLEARIDEAVKRCRDTITLVDELIASQRNPQEIILLTCALGLTGKPSVHRKITERCLREFPRATLGGHCDSRTNQSCRLIRLLGIPALSIARDGRETRQTPYVRPVAR